MSAQPQDVRMGQTFSTDGKTVQTGTMNLTNLRPENIKGGVTIAGVAGGLNLEHLKPENVKKGVDIAGVTGNYSGVLQVEYANWGHSSKNTRVVSIDYLDYRTRFKQFEVGNIEGEVRLSITVYDSTDIKIYVNNDLRIQRRVYGNDRPSYRLKVSPYDVLKFEADSSSFDSISMDFKIKEGAAFCRDPETPPYRAITFSNNF